MLDPIERDPYPWSGWDDLKFTAGALCVLALPFALLAGLFLLL